MKQLPTRYTTNLTETQKSLIATLAEQGRRDREIADAIGTTECRVQFWRRKIGIDASKHRQTGMLASTHCRAVRPWHVLGEYPDRVWFESQNEAFADAMRAELELRDFEAKQIDIEEAIADASRMP